MEGDKPQKAPVLESRETVYASNSRADRVQGKSLILFSLCLYDKHITFIVQMVKKKLF